ncbi:uncharacterized protein [Tiliqua scincoides]|uniref:uncharacterized protein n=1 Tax=Tiliqua scincoides TaxID=71010 RepID=UPI0034633487
MDCGYEHLKTYPDSAPLIDAAMVSQNPLGSLRGDHEESKECFICREGDEMGRDALLHFCDCKNLIAHQKCLLTWIQKGPPISGTPRCKVCTAEYELERKSPWRILAIQWHEWVVSCTILAGMILIPVLVYQMMIAFKDPPPSLIFHIAAICFGVLTEILLTKCLQFGGSTGAGQAVGSGFNEVLEQMRKEDENETQEGGAGGGGQAQ